MDIKDIVLIILVIIVIHLMYKTRNIEKFETVETSVRTAVNDKYTTDIDAIRNLSSLARNILRDNDSFRLPAKNTSMNNLIIDGNVTIMNKDTSYFDIFPKHMIIAINRIVDDNNKPPKGWALCDGRKYSLNTNFDAILDQNGTLTPNLQGRVLIGSGTGRNGSGQSLDTATATSLSTRKFGDYGGEENHKLIVNELPAHSHSVEDGFFAEHKDPWNLVGSGDTDHDNGIYTRTINTGNTGSNQPHNSMQPFYVLSYIMKL